MTRCSQEHLSHTPAHTDIVTAAAVKRTNHLGNLLLRLACRHHQPQTAVLFVAMPASPTGGGSPVGRSSWGGTEASHHQPARLASLKGEPPCKQSLQSQSSLQVTACHLQSWLQCHERLQPEPSAPSILTHSCGAVCFAAIDNCCIHLGQNSLKRWPLPRFSGYLEKSV